MNDNIHERETRRIDIIDCINKGYGVSEIARRLDVPRWAIIRDIKSLEPMRKDGDRGFLEVLTPFGSSASIKHAVIVDDHVELVTRNKCPECGREGATFKILGRVEQSEGIGCSSLIKWV